LTREIPFGKDFPEYPCPVPTHSRLAGTGESREAGCLPQRPGAGIPSYLRRDAAFTACPGTEAATIGKTCLCGLEGADTIDFLAVLAVGEFEIVV